jgi:hypothetical protein
LPRTRRIKDAMMAGDLAACEQAQRQMREAFLNEWITAKKLKPRKIVVGRDERAAEIVIKDQATLRLIEEVVNYLPNERLHHA